MSCRQKLARGLAALAGILLVLGFFVPWFHIEPYSFARGREPFHSPVYSPFSVLSFGSLYGSPFLDVAIFYVLPVLATFAFAREAIFSRASRAPARQTGWARALTIVVSCLGLFMTYILYGSLVHLFTFDSFVYAVVDVGVMLAAGGYVCAFASAVLADMADRAPRVKG